MTESTQMIDLKEFEELLGMPVVCQACGSESLEMAKMREGLLTLANVGGEALRRASDAESRLQAVRDRCETLYKERQQYKDEVRRLREEQVQ